MIENIDISGSNYDVEESLQKYVQKRIGKLDRYLPRQNRKDLVAKVVVTQVNRDHGNKYEISATLDIPPAKKRSLFASMHAKTGIPELLYG